MWHFMHDFSLPFVAMQKLLMTFFFPMRVVPVRPGICTSSPSHTQCEVFITFLASGWHARHARVTACGLSSFSGMTAA